MTDENGQYGINVIGGIAGQGCVVASAVRKTSTFTDSVSAAPVALMLREVASRPDSVRVDVVLP